MLDSVGIRLPKYKVREVVLKLKNDGQINEEVIDKLSFIQVSQSLES